VGGLETIYVQANKAMPKGSIAHTAIYECLKAAYLQDDFQTGLDVEKEQFIRLVISKESAAMRHLFFAQRAAPKVQGIDSKLAKPIKSVGILGAGLMGGGIAMCFMKKGVPVVLKDAKQEWLDSGVEAIKKNYQIQVKKRKLTEEKYQKLMSLLKPTLNYEDFRGVDLIIEAVPEIMPLKKQVFQDLGKVVGPDTLVCTNTSGLNIDEIATAIPNPSRVMGTHFFSPANVMQLLENVRTKEASDQTIATCMAMGKLIGKQTVLVGNCDGFVGNRMVAPYSSEARMMIEEGCDAAFMDDIVQNEFGMAMGPMSLGDLVGHQLFYNQRKTKGDMKADTKTCMGPHDLTDMLVEADRVGQKNGKGVYNYDVKTRKKLGVDESVKAGVRKIQERKKTQVRSNWTKDEIIERLFFSMANEGFKILEEGFAQRPSDVDIVYIYGYGFPPVKGGPLFWVDTYVGLDKFLAKLKKYDAEMKARAAGNPEYRYYDYFKPSALLEKCVAEGKTLERYWAAQQKAKAKM
jgi:3-hydroxyacyl-CoA dehydrogenase